MSYGQPPTKTPYGDQDFIKEDFTPHQPNQAPYANRDPRVVAPNPAPYPGPNQQMAYAGQNMTPQTGPNGQYSVSQRPAVPSLTPEDQLFIRSWRNDSLMFRILPIGLGTSSAYWYYNKSRGLPNKISRYVGIAIISIFAGNYSYRKELARRLEETPLNTPFITALRQMAGLRQPLTGVDEFAAEDPSLGSGWNTGEPAYERPYTDQPPPANYTSGPYNQAPSSADGQFNQNLRGHYETDLSSPPAFGGEPGKSATSYEELRARNRGILQK